MTSTVSGLSEKSHVIGRAVSVPAFVLGHAVLGFEPVAGSKYVDAVIFLEDK